MSFPFHPLLIGPALALPWFDRLALWGVGGPYMRLSRAWASAAVAEGSVGRFLSELPLARLPAGAEWPVTRALRHVSLTGAAAGATTRAWEAAFFAGRSPGTAALASAERKRRATAHAHMWARARFASWPLYPRLPPVRYAIADETALDERYADVLRRPESAYLPPALPPDIEASHRMAGAAGIEYWLRFPSPIPAVGGWAWAHVFEPEGARDPPSLVFAHGLCVELEMLDGVTDWMTELVRLGVRLVRLEAPWHSRRARPGSYGGEPFLATQPLGGLDFFGAEVREMALLVAWCRRDSAGRVAIGGTSLGALASQIAASHARFWPPAMRPDALLLITASDRVGDLVFSSSLARAIALGRVLARHGWTKARLARWHSLADPLDEPSLAPRDIVMLLGARDDVLPFARGRALAERWRVPEENLFIRPRGHFSVDLGLLVDPAPLRRLAALLQAG